MIAAMLIFGSLGIFVSMIPLPTSFIAMSRSVIGTIFLAVVILISGKKPDIKNIKRNAVYLIISGVALGFNWILLFEAYRHTTIAVATLCYYMAPVFMILLSPFILKEKMTPLKALCSAAAVGGAVLISGAAAGDNGSIKGVLFGLSAAVLYCSIVMMNKFMRDMTSLDTTFIQLAISAVIMIPYVLLTQDIKTFTFSGKTIFLVLLVGIVHTGLAYLLYFSSVQEVSAQTTAVFSYIDPVTAIVLSAVILNQSMSAVQICGTVLILGATLANEIIPFVKSKKELTK